MFETLTVLSIEQATALPFLTLRLAMEGMRVIRVERPPRGDPNRWVGPQVLARDGEFEAGMNAYYLPNNLGKQSIALDLASPSGRKLLHRLIVETPVDIFATNQRPGSYARLGIDYQTLAALKPDLIWLGITGFGPEHDESAYDPILQARAGFMDLTGEPDGGPIAFGLPMVDLGAGEHGYGAIMRALYRRAVTGEGQRLDVSMFHSAVSWMVSPYVLRNCFQIELPRQGNTHRFFAPVSVYPTSDGFVYMAVGTDQQWRALTGLNGFGDLNVPAYEHNQGRIEDSERLNQRIGARTRAWTTGRLIEALQASRIPASHVNRVADLADDALVSEGLVRSVDPRTGVEISLPGPPLVYPYLLEQGMRMGFPPRLGEHNAEVLAGLGATQRELQEAGTA